MASSMSNRTGISQNTTSRSVMAKSWIIVERFTATGSWCTSRPLVSMTRYWR